MDVLEERKNRSEQRGMRKRGHERNQKKKGNNKENRRKRGRKFVIRGKKNWKCRLRERIEGSREG